jgi:hypothetical protein
MRKFLTAFTLILLITGNGYSLTVDVQTINPNQSILPSPFPIASNGQVVINHPAPGFTTLYLPTNNDYKGNPGCYVACYSHDAKLGIYPVGKDIFVNGQVRVPGTYNGTLCNPSSAQSKDTNQANEFKNICRDKIESCKSTSCWTGGDTGGWFGIP